MPPNNPTGVVLLFPTIERGDAAAAAMLSPICNELRRRTALHIAGLMHLAGTSYRAVVEAKMFGGAAERLTNDDAANTPLKPAYRKHR